MARPLLSRTAPAQLWTMLKHSSPLYTVFQRVTKRQAVFLLLLVLGDGIALGSMVTVAHAHGLLPTTRQVSGVSIAGVQAGRVPQPAAGTAAPWFVSADQLGTLTPLADDVLERSPYVWAPGENLDGAGGAR